MRRNGPRAAYLVVDRPAVSVGATPRDKIGVALDRFLGVQADTLERIIEAGIFSDRTRARLATEQRGQMRLHGEFPGLRASSFEEVRQALEAEQASWQVSQRVKESQASSDFANVLANTLNRRGLSSYTEAEYGERTLMVPGVARDLRDQNVVAIDAAPDIPTVDPESVNYTELPKLAERVMTGVMSQKGVIVTITRKVIINDDVAVVQRLIDEVGRAARRTLARAVWAVWTSKRDVRTGQHGVVPREPFEPADGGAQRDGADRRDPQAARSDAARQRRKDGHHRAARLAVAHGAARALGHRVQAESDDGLGALSRFRR
jgi:hypothetical protein